MAKKNYHHGDLKNALIAAGIEILSKEGVGALSLRKVACRAGVSHTAPYAHFADKQALIAAIATEGYEKLHTRISEIVRQYHDAPERQLAEAAWAYVDFAINETDHFKITLSSVLEKEKDYPAYVEISHKNFQLVVEIIEACQRTGILPAGPSDLLAVLIWGLLHGLVSLVLEGQVSHTILDRFTLKDMVESALNLATGVRTGLAGSDLTERPTMSA